MTTAPANGRVFVSSTCNDLLDLRAQLEVTLRDAGLIPILSDRPASEFYVPGDANAIETCLVNLRNSEHCIVVLSQRYGHSLESAGFADLSATHLEYREARKHNLPVTLYVRDRLLAEFELSKSNRRLETRWTPPEDAKKLFALIEEHAKLENSAKPNYFRTYTTASDLCQRVVLDLGAASMAARIRMLTAHDRLPVLSLHHSQSQGNVRTLILKNVGALSALRVSVLHPLGNRVLAPTDLAGGQEQSFGISFETEIFSRGTAHSPVFRVDYETPNGDRLRDLFAILPSDDSVLRIVPAGRNVIGRSLRSTVPTIETVGGCAMIPLGPINEAHATYGL